MPYTPRTTPRAHQVEALRRLTVRPPLGGEDVMAWLMDMGTGKSKVVCDEFGEREYAGDLQDLLIVAPSGSYRNWNEDKTDIQLSQFKTHMSDDLNERMLTAAWVSGAGVRYQRELEHFLKQRDPKRPRALLINTEALSSVQKARDLLKAYLQTPGRRTMFAVDESTGIKTHDSNRTKHIVKAGHLAPGTVRRILTGSPAPNGPLDLYSQFEFLDWRILRQRSYYAFRTRYAIIKDIYVGGEEDERGNIIKQGRKVSVVVNYRNVDELQGLISPYSYRVLKKDCLDIPEKVYAPIRHVELTDEQRRIYKEMKEYATARISEDGDAYTTATQVIVQMMRLHQLNCGYAVDDDGNGHEVPSRRIDQLMEVLQEHTGKAVIWVNYDWPLRRIIERLSKEYGPKSVAAFWGGNLKTRAEDERRFLGDPDCRWMVSTQQAGGLGNTWTVANLVVYFSNNHDLMLRDQSEDRAHRDGQREEVTYVDLVSPGTVDEKIIYALRNKINLATAITGEGFRSWLV